MKNLIITIACLFPLLANAQKQDNAELKKMYEEDQGARMVANINWSELHKQDSTREKRVYEMISQGLIVTGKDYYHSAMIFQHGRDSVAYGMAVKQMRKAVELDSNVNKWLLAAAIDRELMSRNKPQIYGTQYIKKSMNAKWERYKIDSTQVTDAERKYYRVESLAEQREKEIRMNQLNISKYYDSTKSIDQTILFIRSEAKKPNATYDVSESSINTFAYNLLSNKHTDEALKVFLLNTELYPGGFNTFDSLGECLLIVGKKQEGLAAYKKSLELNPNNDNAKKVLAENK
ncbi:MAG: hypothetical protein J0I41_05310 [Filimonas sp.]|nr:hypothetical protein [Filimonas sp.]